MKDDGGPAFPQLPVDFGNGPEDPGPFKMGGMSLRDYFAGQALIGYNMSAEYRNLSDDKTAAWAYATADAMLRARGTNGD